MILRMSAELQSTRLILYASLLFLIMMISVMDMMEISML